MAWGAWVTFELLSRRCAEQPELVHCSILPASLQTTAPHNVPAIIFPDDVISLRVSEVEHRVDRLESVPPPPRNFAVGGDGAVILKAFTSPTYVPVDNPVPSIFGPRSSQLPPSTLLDDSVAVGRCWEFVGQQGHIGIGLTENAYIRSISLDHAHPSLTKSTSARKAPQDFLLWGLYPSEHAEVLPAQTQPASYFLLSRSFPAGISLNDRFILLVNGSYDTFSPTTRQYFNVSPSLWQTLPAPVGIVVLEILNNWGASSTCIYSVGIHGESLSESVSLN